MLRHTVAITRSPCPLCSAVVTCGSITQREYISHHAREAALSQPVLATNVSLSTARRDIARYGTVRHGTARCIAAWHGTARWGTARRGAAQRDVTRCGTARHGVRCRRGPPWARLPRLGLWCTRQRVPHRPQAQFRRLYIWIVKAMPHNTKPCGANFPNNSLQNRVSIRSVVLIFSISRSWL